MVFFPRRAWSLDRRKLQSRPKHLRRAERHCGQRVPAWKFRVDLFACGTRRFRILRAVHGFYPYFLSTRGDQPACGIPKDSRENGHNTRCKLNGCSERDLRCWDISSRGRDPYEKFARLVDDGWYTCSAGRLGECFRGKDRITIVRSRRMALQTHRRRLRSQRRRANEASWSKRHSQISSRRAT